MIVRGITDYHSMRPFRSDDDCWSVCAAQWNTIHTLWAIAAASVTGIIVLIPCNDDGRILFPGGRIHDRPHGGAEQLISQRNNLFVHARDTKSTIPWPTTTLSRRR